jgi:hypothetical protein
MLNLLGLGRGNRKGVRVTIEYCPKSVTLPYKVKKLINQASINIPTNKKDSFGFTDKKIRVGEFLNETQLEILIDQSKQVNAEIDEIEIIESSSLSSDLLLD